MNLSSWTDEQIFYIGNFDDWAGNYVLGEHQESIPVNLWKSEPGALGNNASERNLIDFKILSDYEPDRDFPLKPYTNSNFAFISKDGLDNEITISGSKDIYIQVIDLTNFTTINSGQETISFKPLANTVYGGLAWYADNRDEDISLSVVSNKVVNWAESEIIKNNDPYLSGDKAVLEKGIQNKRYEIKSEDLLKGYSSKTNSQLYVDDIQAISYKQINFMPDDLLPGSEGFWEIKHYGVDNYEYNSVYLGEDLNSIVLKVTSQDELTKFWVQTYDPFERDEYLENLVQGSTNLDGFNHDFVSNLMFVFEDSNSNNILDNEDEKQYIFKHNTVLSDPNRPDLLELYESYSEGGYWENDLNPAYPFELYDKKDGNVKGMFSVSDAQFAEITSITEEFDSLGNTKSFEGNGKYNFFPTKDDSDWFNL